MTTQTDRTSGHVPSSDASSSDVRLPCVPGPAVPGSAVSRPRPAARASAGMALPALREREGASRGTGLPVPGEHCFPEPRDDEDICPVCGNCAALVISRAADFVLLQCTCCSLVTRHDRKAGPDDRVDFRKAIPEDERPPRGKQDLNRFFGLRLSRRSLQRLRRYCPASLWRPGARFLDAGSGRGFLVELARQDGLQATGIEQDESLVAWAEEHFPDARFVTGRLEDRIDSLLEIARETQRPAEGGSGEDSAENANNRPEQKTGFDLVYCHLALQECDDMVPFVQGLARLVRPGGCLVVRVNDSGHWRRARHIRDWPLFWPERDRYLLNRKALRSILGRAGFSLYFRGRFWNMELCAVARRAEDLPPEGPDPFALPENVRDVPAGLPVPQSVSQSASDQEEGEDGAGDKKKRLAAPDKKASESGPEDVAEEDVAETEAGDTAMARPETARPGTGRSEANTGSADQIAPEDAPSGGSEPEAMPSLDDLLNNNPLLDDLPEDDNSESKAGNPG